MQPITITYPVRPRRCSLACNAVADLFGLAPDEAPLVVADNVTLDIRPGDIALFVGPSGSGKSSLLRVAERELDAIDANALKLPDEAIIDGLPGELRDKLDLLSACGLAEARLLLRRPDELSDGQRCRYRLALASSRCRKPGQFILADEFCAVLDRTLARTVAFNLRKLCTRMKVGALLATTHDDFIDDLQPDLLVQCHGDGAIDIERRQSKKKRISFANEFWLSAGSVADWAYFSRWHYRSHALGFVRRVVVLWHGECPVGICVFASPAASLALRTRYFGLRRPRSREHLGALNRQLWVLARVVLHPTYRGAGVAAAFVRRACETCPVPWIEALAAMGQVNPFFERAGFERVGVIRKTKGAGGAYGGRRRYAPKPQSRWSEPVYYVFRNSSGR